MSETLPFTLVPCSTLCMLHCISFQLLQPSSPRIRPDQALLRLSSACSLPALPTRAPGFYDRHRRRTRATLHHFFACCTLVPPRVKFLPQTRPHAASRPLCSASARAGALGKKTVPPPFPALVSFGIPLQCGPSPGAVGSGLRLAVAVDRLGDQLNRLGISTHTRKCCLLWLLFPLIISFQRCRSAFASGRNLITTTEWGPLLLPKALQHPALLLSHRKATLPLDTALSISLSFLRSH